MLFTAVGWVIYLFVLLFFGEVGSSFFDVKLFSSESPKVVDVRNIHLAVAYISCSKIVQKPSLLSHNKKYKHV